MNDLIMMLVLVNVVAIKVIVGLLLYVVVEKHMIANKNTESASENAPVGMLAESNEATEAYKKAINQEQDFAGTFVPRKRKSFFANLPNHGNEAIDQFATERTFSSQNTEKNTSLPMGEYHQEPPVIYHSPIVTESIPEDASNVFSMKEARQKRNRRMLGRG